VLRLLRGESLDLLARETGQAAGTISGWREEFLAAGREGLKSRPRAEEDRRLIEAQRKIGELSMDLDIMRALNEEIDRALAGRGAERLKTAGASAGPGLPGRGALQVGGVRAAPPTQHLGAHRSHRSLSSGAGRGDDRWGAA